MRKCPDCNGCLKFIWLYGKTYKYCSFCRTVYKLEPGGGFIIITDPDIIQQIFKLVGNKI